MTRFFEWRDSGGQPYLFAQGETPFDLGYAVGQGAKGKIDAARAVYARVIAGSAVPGLDAAVGAYIANISPPLLEELEGMLAGYLAAGGEDMSLETLAIQSFGVDLTHRFAAPSLAGCTSFACINPDGSVTHGQNYDSDPRLTAADLFVHSRTRGCPDQFLYRPGGSLGMALGKNECGVAMTVCVVKSRLISPCMTPRAVLVRRAMAMDSAADAVAAMADDRGHSPFCYNLIVSDRHSAAGVQAIPEERRVSWVKRTLVHSNQLDYVDWQRHLLRPAYSKKRQRYGEELLDGLYARYGGVDEATLLEILRDAPVICRKAVGDGIGTTVLFMTRTHFGHGNPQDAPPGVIPI